MRADYEQVLNVVLRTIGVRPGDVQRHAVQDVVVVLGDGQFTSVRGRASFHEKVAEFLYQKVRIDLHLFSIGSIGIITDMGLTQFSFLMQSSSCLKADGSWHPGHQSG